MRMPWKSSQSKAESHSAKAAEGVEVIDVFTPSVPAGRGFVGRESEIKNLRIMGFQMPGTQIVIWGESGAGKSSLINKALTDYGYTAVKTACTPDSTFEEILAAAFSGTGAFVITESTERSDTNIEISTTVGNELIGAKVSSGFELTNSTGQTLKPLARPQLDPQRLVAELGKRNLSWVIEDFHKVDVSVRERLAHALKIFSDEGKKYPSTRIIVLGVSESVDELVSPPTNINNRLIDIMVPPLAESELGEILDIGEELLNLDFSKIRDRLLATSVGTASITHALALTCCNQREVSNRSTEPVVFTNEDFESAVESYARTRSSSLKGRFEKALQVHRKRIYDNPRLILRALSELPESGGTVGEIIEIIRRDHSTYPSGNATTYLRILLGEERGALVRRTTSGKYRFDEPLQHAYAKTLFGLTDPSSKQPVSHWDQVVPQSI